VVRARTARFCSSRGGRQVLGLPAGDLAERSFFDFVPSDYAVLFESGMSALRGEASRVPMHLERADGHLVDVELLVMDCPSAGIDAWAGQDLALISAVDTTRRNRASRRIIAREEQLRKIMDNVADAVVVVDEEGCIETLNRATEAAFGLASRELVGTGVGRLLGPAEAADGRAMTGLEAFLGGGVPARVSGWRRHQGRRANGDLFPIEVAVRDLNLGERHLFIGLIRDISERVAYEENILYMATHDLLTTLANRTRFHDELGVVLVRAKQAEARFGVMFFDLDHFKAINDSFGHLVGDRILSVFAKRLQTALGDRARLVARLSADEFVAIFEDSGGTAELLPLARRVCEAAKKPVVVDNHYIRISCCIGIAEYPDAGPYAEDLMRGAEFAVRTAKAQGRIRAGLRRGAVRQHGRIAASGNRLTTALVGTNSSLLLPRSLAMRRGDRAVALISGSTRKLGLVPRFHPDRRGNRPDPRHRRMGVAPGLPRSGGLAVHRRFGGAGGGQPVRGAVPRRQPGRHPAPHP
jgi:diguanylate cyclase (GGDEF)-like protein/PAS domain S-box-containing protein